MLYTAKNEAIIIDINYICSPLTIQWPAATLRFVVLDLCWRMVGRPKDSTRETRRFRNGGEIYYFQHSSYFVHQTHTLKTHSSHLRHQNPETLRVPRRYKKHHNNQINIYKTRLQRCLAAWHIHCLTSTFLWYS